MGCCCSCTDNANGTTRKENELVEHEDTKQCISVHMSNPAIKVHGNLCATGSGLALTGTALEQDSAYWEFHVTLPTRKHADTVLFGVSSMKDRKFYKELEEKGPKDEG